jgi:hypothetical protein
MTFLIIVQFYNFRGVRVAFPLRKYLKSRVSEMTNYFILGNYLTVIYMHVSLYFYLGPTLKAGDGLKLIPLTPCHGAQYFVTLYLLSCPAESYDISDSSFSFVLSSKSSSLTPGTAAMHNR